MQTKKNIKSTKVYTKWRSDNENCKHCKCISTVLNYAFHKNSKIQINTINKSQFSISLKKKPNPTKKSSSSKHPNLFVFLPLSLNVKEQEKKKNLLINKIFAKQKKIARKKYTQSQENETVKSKEKKKDRKRRALRVEMKIEGHKTTKRH